MAQITPNIIEAETAWLKAIASKQADQIAEELIQPTADAVVEAVVAVVADAVVSDAAAKTEPVAAVETVEKCPPTKDNSEYGMTDGVIVPPNPVAIPDSLTDNAQPNEPVLSFGEQVIVDRMDDLISIMSDIRDRFATSNGGMAVSSTQEVAPNEDSGGNLSQALLAALTITDGILSTTRK